eukprot:764171-Hanusia_phi.AAC.9
MTEGTSTDATCCLPDRRSWYSSSACGLLQTCILQPGRGRDEQLRRRREGVQHEGLVRKDSDGRKRIATTTNCAKLRKVICKLTIRIFEDIAS